MATMRLARKQTSFPVIDIRPRPPPLEKPMSIDREDTELENSSEGHEYTQVETIQSAQNQTHADSLIPIAQTLPREGSGHPGQFSAKRVRVSNSKIGRPDRRHQCSICSQCFARAEHLNRHERSREYFSAFHSEVS